MTMLSKPETSLARATRMPAISSARRSPPMPLKVSGHSSAAAAQPVPDSCRGSGSTRSSSAWVGVFALGFLGH